jgi:hypothetical protein
MVAKPGSGEGFWDAYRRSLKPLPVEEPIDLWVHRPLGYVLARVCAPTPITPTMITVGSLLLGVASGASMIAHYPWHLQIAGLLLVLSAAFDCADGQLARMQGTASPFGRALDGTADLLVTIAFVGGCGWVMIERHWDVPWLRYAIMAALAVTAVTSSFHTTMFDHFKNAFLRMTVPTYRDAEDYETALARYRARDPSSLGFAARFSWPIYLFYVKSQEDYMRGFDPFTAPRLSALPPFDPVRARIYERHAAPVLAILRGWFGPGSLAFGIALCSAFDVFEFYLLYRLVGLNVIFYGWVRPAQRRASREAFREMGVRFDGGPAEERLVA